MARSAKLLGEVNLLGLNQFGQNPGLDEKWGILVGGGTAALTSMVVGRTAKADRKEAFGLLAGLGVSGVLYAMKSTRHAALWSAAGAMLGAGLSWLEKVMFASKGVAGMGIPSVNYLNGLGVPTVNYLNGLGIPEIWDVPQSQGTIPGVHGPSFAGSRLGENNPVDLLGAATPQSEKIALMGGPAVHGLSAAYGATLLGGGRN